jgi:deoxyribodipyrimidine photo-lyase
LIVTAIFWFRRDLRLADNPALAAALAGGHRVVAVYIDDRGAAEMWRDGGAARWWLHHSLTALEQSVQSLGSRLILRSGDATLLIPNLAAELAADAVYCNQVEEPWALRQQAKIAERLRRDSRALVAGRTAFLFEPDDIRTQSGAPFRMFTPFWRACLAQPSPAIPLDAPDSMPGWSQTVPSETLADWALLPYRPDWAQGLRRRWHPGEKAAQRALDAFVAGPLACYASERDRPDLPATSALSPHLRWGEISARQVWHAVTAQAPPSPHSDKFLAELGWREFSGHLLAQFADLPTHAMRPEFEHMPWRTDQAATAAWQQGRTGFPIVDAGMRQLWDSGWMHNRVRMVVASFLVKTLLISWQTGARWFWDTLVDADLASNAASWQWVAGCGADAAPFFRIFNPVLQGEKFDPSGDYVRAWCPELAGLPNEWLQRPWLAPPAVLASAGILLGRDYPWPIVDLAACRIRALAAYKGLSG